MSSGRRVCGHDLCCSQALAEEKVAYERSTSRNIYLNVAVNTLKKLRSLVPNSPTSTNSRYLTAEQLEPCWHYKPERNLFEKPEPISQQHYAERQTAPV